MRTITTDINRPDDRASKDLEKAHKAYIHSVYPATEGEGVLIGSPQVFIRFQGCAVGCVNCDSVETWGMSKSGPGLEEQELFGHWRDIESLVDSLETDPELAVFKRVSITGGDPLHPQNVPAVREMIRLLKAKNYWVNIEAAGTRTLTDIFEAVDFVSFDIKTPSTEVRVNRKALETFIVQFKEKGQIKAVIENKRDFDFVFNLWKELKALDPVGVLPWVLTPAYNLEDSHCPRGRVLDIMGLNIEAGCPFRVIVQQHKFLHGPNKRDV